MANPNQDNDNKGFQIADPFLRKIVMALGAMAVIAFGIYTFSLIKPAIQMVFNVLTPFLLAFVLAYVMAPIVIALQRRLKLGRVGGTFALYLIVLLAIFIALAILIPTALSQGLQLADSVKEAYSEWTQKLEAPTTGTLRQDVPLNFTGGDETTSGALISVTQADDQATSPTSREWLELQATELLREGYAYLSANLEQIAASMAPALKQVASGGLDAAGGVAKWLFSGIGQVIGLISFLVFVGIINFYIILDWEKIGPLARQMIPPERRDQSFAILSKIDVAVGGFLRGQLTVSALVGLFFAIGLFFIGQLAGFPALRNYSLLIGMAAAIGGFIPYLGPIMGCTPAVLIVLLTPNVEFGGKLVSLLLVLGLFSAIQTLEGFVLQPRIVGKGAGLHPLVVMLALLAGAQFGIGGMILAVPLASIIRVLVREFYWLPLLERDKASESSHGDTESTE
ncbi:AI-2E family transporter [Candidatus Sumerlaeota bacterium]|nr:AI-2E family transporter [Candidatus Sumerlaeota bacterium]